MARKRRKRSHRRRTSRGLFKSNTPRRRRRRSHRSNTPARTHRRSRRRSYRRNPPRVQSLFTDTLWAGAGFIGTKFVGNMVMPMIGVTQPIARIGVKAGLAYVTAWGVEMMMGRGVFTPVFLGGMAEVIQDTVRNFISPMFPALAAAEYPLEAYYEGMSQYALPENSGVSQYDTAESVGAYEEV